MVWNEETIRHLRDLWAEGHSTAEIGRRLGVSKNAIVGKAHRLELDARPSPIRREVLKAAPDRNSGYPRVVTTLPPLPSDSLPAIAAAHNVQPLRIAPAAPQTIARAAETGPHPSTDRPYPPAASRVPTVPTAVQTNTVAPAPAAAVTVVAPAVAVAEKPSFAALRQAAPVPVRRAAPACCWPIGDPGTKAFHFCDDASLPGKPYCDEHAKLAYVKVRDRKEDAA